MDAKQKPRIVITAAMVSRLHSRLVRAYKRNGFPGDPFGRAHYVTSVVKQWAAKENARAR